MILKKLLEEFNEEHIKEFIQKNEDYYISKWKVMAEKNSKVSWNWPAFLFTVPWLGYRKMYSYAFIYLLLSVLTFIPVLEFFILIALWIGIGVFGNYLYGKYTYTKLVELKNNSNDDESFKNSLEINGGTSIAGIFIVLLMAVGVSLFITILMYAIFSSQY